VSGTQPAFLLDEVNEAVKWDILYF